MTVGSWGLRVAQVLGGDDACAMLRHVTDRTGIAIEATGLVKAFGGTLARMIS